MGFFDFQQKAVDQELKGVSTELLHKAQCKACPLNNLKGLKHPHMAPYGSEKPVVYILGEAPGAEEDARGRPFVGPAGQVLRMRIPKDWDSYLRWNNCVRTRPPNNRTPHSVEIECCRPSVEADIEATKPRAIFGFGNVALQWALGREGGIDGGISVWRGKRIPVKIGKHECWFYPMFHPSYVLRSRKFHPRSARDFGSDIEFTFAFDLKRAFAEVENLPKPFVHTREHAIKNIDIITGDNGIDDVKRVYKLLDTAAQHKRVGYDYETNGLRPYNKNMKLLSVGLAYKDYAASFALSHRESKWSKKYKEQVYDALEEFLYEAPCQKVVHNLPFELEWSGVFFGEEVIRKQPWGCSRAQAYILDERTRAQSLDSLCLQHFGLHLKNISNLNRKKIDNEPLPAVLHYNGLDAKYHLALYNHQARLLEEQGLMKRYLGHLERMPTMVLTQIKGIPVDPTIVEQLNDEWSSKIDLIENEILELKIVDEFKRKFHKDFNPASNSHVKKLVNGLLKANVLSVDEHELGRVKHPIAKKVIELRKAEKLLSTYITPLRKGAPTLYDDGRLHPQLHTTTTISGRTSSDGPNEQNFPKHKNKEVRKQIRPKADERVVSFDYGQIQARNVAMESKDAALIKAFWDRYDIHEDWAYRIRDKYPRWVKEGKNAFNDKLVLKKYRQRAKNELVFASFFGAQPYKLSLSLGIPIEPAERLFDDFWHMFPDVHLWHEYQRNFYRENGYVTGLSGYRRRAPCSPTEMINAPIQADEAEIVCDAMTRLSKIDFNRYQANIEVHDDLTFIWNVKDIDENAEVVIREMLNVPFEWAKIVPIQVDMSIGKDWCDFGKEFKFESDRWKGGIKEVISYD